MSHPARTPVRPRRRHSKAMQRGAVAIEMLIVLPLLAVIAFGTVEMGLAWQDSREVNNATRAAARVASNLADDRFADFEALLTLRAGLSGVDNDDIASVIVYKADDVNGTVPPACIVGGGTSVLNVCNSYTAAQLAALSVSDFPGTTSCAGALDSAWCPLNRDRDPLGSPDYIGIYVHIEREPVTGIFPGVGQLVNITDSAVMRAEPEVG